MKTRDLVKMVKSGSKPIIKFTERISDIESADEGMMGRVISVSSPDVWERGTETVEFRIDMSEFLEHNRSVAQVGWRDSYGDPVLTWMDSDYYPKDNIETICEMLVDNFNDCDLSMFEVVNVSKYFEEFLAQNEIKDYVRFLENKLDGNIF